MFSSRRLKAIVLLIAVLVAVFVLFEPYFIQEAAADCDTAQIACEMMERYAWWICDTQGQLSAACADAQGYAVRECIRRLHECRWGG